MFQPKGETVSRKCGTFADPKCFVQQYLINVRMVDIQIEIEWLPKAPQHERKKTERNN